jgi:CHAD domain-containing protein
VRAGLTAPEADRDKAIHEARQAFKRLRALVRLAKPPLGSDFAAENRRWRDAGRLLSGSRDTTVLLESFDKLVADRGAELPPDAVGFLRARIAAKGVEADATHVEENVRCVLVLLDDAEASVAELEWPNGKIALLRGFHRGQKRLRRDWKDACKEAGVDALHSWRKRVKDQSAQLRLFRRVMPDDFRVRRNVEKETAELLGDEHDFWLLAEHLRAESIPSDFSGIRDLLLGDIEQRRSALRQKAFEKGEDFSSQKAKAFARAIGIAWDKASRRDARRRPRKRRNPEDPVAVATTSPSR